MAELVYGLCAFMSLVCSILLFKRNRENRTPLLFWSALCFFGFALNNFILFLDVVIVPQTDLSTIRIAPAVFGICALVYGLVTEEA